MIDIKLLIEDFEGIAFKLERRSKGIKEKLKELIDLYKTLKLKKQELEEKRHKIKIFSKQGEIELAKQLKQEIKQLEVEVKEYNKKYENLLSEIPNIPDNSVPDGVEGEKIDVRYWGKKPEFNFPYRDHVEIGKITKTLDFERAAKLAGSGFPMYMGDGALIEWALLTFFIHENTKKGYKFIFPPYLLREQPFFIAGNLPKFRDQLYFCKEDKLFLLPTAESALAGLHGGEILDEDDLPLFYTAFSPCFRREAGSWGKDVKGLIRMHQFHKVEMFCLCKPEDSFDILEKMVKDAEDLVQKLNLYYRVTLLAAGDISFASAKTYDVEVYLPSLNDFKEVSSVSNTTDFQARRGGIRFKRKNGKKEFVHMLNGSGLATSRLLPAIMEQNQTQDGKFNIPEVLLKYLL